MTVVKTNSLKLHYTGSCIHFALSQNGYRTTYFFISSECGLVSKFKDIFEVSVLDGAAMQQSNTGIGFLYSVAVGLGFLYLVTVGIGFRYLVPVGIGFRNLVAVGIDFLNLASVDMMYNERFLCR